MTVNTKRAPDAHERAEDVTRKQQRTIATEWRVMAAVREWYETHKWTHPPAVREIAELAGVSDATTCLSLKRLHRAGLVIYTGRARGLWLAEHD